MATATTGAVIHSAQNGFIRRQCFAGRAFGISAAEASSMDPQQRLLLEHGSGLSDAQLAAIRRCQAAARGKEAVLEASSEHSALRTQLDAMRFVDEQEQAIDHLTLERAEQLAALSHVQPRHRVLELGARYGTVSAAIQLKRPAFHLAVEPDARVWAALHANLAANRCGGCEVERGFISRQPLALYSAGVDGYSAHGVRATDGDAEPGAAPCRPLEAVLRERGVPSFTALVADCEGGLGTFLLENPGLLCEGGLELLIFEADRPDLCDYAAIRAELRRQGFACKASGVQNVWLRASAPPGAAALTSCSTVLARPLHPT
jgi:FkbM family methyltransferase